MLDHAISGWGCEYVTGQDYPDAEVGASQFATVKRMGPVAWVPGCLGAWAPCLSCMEYLVHVQHRPWEELGGGIWLGCYIPVAAQRVHTLLRTCAVCRVGVTRGRCTARHSTVHENITWPGDWKP